MCRFTDAPLITGNCLIKKTDLKLFCFEMFNIAAFQESFPVKRGELKTIVGNDVFRIIVVAKHVVMPL